MQAEHIPVHLGSMPDAVAAILSEEQRPGESWILNDPFRGGTHLPDITLITPVFEGRAIAGFVASRAHHADVGGPTPGSMPAGSTIPCGRGRGHLPAPPRRRFRARRDHERHAQPPAAPCRPPGPVGGKRAGSQAAEELIAADGLSAVSGAMREILDYSERRTRARLAELDDGNWEASDVLEGGSDGSEDITLRVQGDDHRRHAQAGLLRQRRTRSPGTSTAPCRSPGRPRSSVSASSWIRTPRRAPGAHRPIEVVAPEGSVLNARSGAAVAGGNVETSSRVADLVFSALADVADGPAQGPGHDEQPDPGRNGRPRVDVLRDAGRRPGRVQRRCGPSAVHVAMSNTLNTPVEALETELPLRVRELSVRRGSGGKGAHPGGDGIVRELEALEPMRYSLITERRRHPPRGRAGGENGQRGATPSTGKTFRRRPGRVGRRRHAQDRDAGRRGIRLPERGLGRLTANRNFSHILGKSRKIS